MSACEEETTTSAMLVTIRCRALTVIAPLLPESDLICSLRIREPRPSGSAIVWFGVPDTTTGVPFRFRSRITELPEADEVLPAQRASACEDSTFAVTVIPATERPRFSMEASDWLWVPDPEVEAARVSAVTRPGTLAAASAAFRLPPEAGRKPVSVMTVCTPSTFDWKTVARPL